MDKIYVCFEAIIPIFTYLLLGIVCRITKLLDDTGVNKINNLSFALFIPLSIFNSLYNTELSVGKMPEIAALIVLGVMTEFIISSIAVKKSVRDENRRGVIIQAMFRTNFVIVGLPFIRSLAGDEGVAVASVMLAFFTPLSGILCVLALNSGRNEKIKLRKMVEDTLKNPLVVGALAGIIVSVTKLRMPKQVSNMVSELSKIGSPLQLICLGAFFKIGNIKKNFRLLLSVSAARLIAAPLILLSAAMLAGFKGAAFIAAIGAFAGPVSVSSFPTAQQMGGDAGLAGDIVVATSALCPLTLFLISVLFKSLNVF